MDELTAQILLSNLLERVERSADTGKRRLEGVISEAEWEALNLALHLLQRRGASAERPEEGSKSSTPRNVEGKRGLSEEDIGRLSRCLALREPEDPRVTLCLDFGTAMSKAFATRSDGEGESELLELGLGVRGGEGAAVYPVSSSIWISDEGRVFFGREAVVRSLQYGEGTRKRLDSMKQYLSLGLPGSLEESPVEAAVNPSGVPLTMADAITLYLAYLTDLAVTELTERHGISKYVKRHFALPCWQPDRRQWGEQLLRMLLARAQVVADVLHGLWAGGIPTREAKRILDGVKALSNPPLYLVGSGVLEPIAAGSSRIRSDRSTRGLLAVVDVGAGTTDFALFYVRRLEDGRWRAWRPTGAARAIRQAGDTIDNILRVVMLEKARVARDEANFQLVDASLRLRIRELKERLFLDRELTERLENDTVVTIQLDEFLARDEVKAFAVDLRRTFGELLATAHPSFFDRLGGAGLLVMLTGGGATMPMVQELAAGRSQIGDHVVQHRAAPLVPEFLGQEYPGLAREYPQLAVAIGGASPELVEEMAELAEMPGAAIQKWSIGGYYTKGV